MSTITSKELHHETSAVLDQVERGHSFEVTRNGKIIGRIQPAAKGKVGEWAEIMQPVWEAQKRCKAKVSNPVLQERERRRR